MKDSIERGGNLSDFFDEVAMDEDCVDRGEIEYAVEE